MRRSTRKKKQAARRREHGVITVFVALMMVPVVVITSVMVDLARVKLYSSQAIMAADSYGEAVLSEYDNLLKELYGLFSVTQNEEGLSAIESFSELVGYSLNPGGDGTVSSGFMPYKDADVKLTYTPVDDASLSNNNVLETQIGDFMKYRVVGQIVDGFDVLGALSQLSTVEADNEVANTYAEIAENSSDALEKMEDYYKALKKLKEYPTYLDGRRDDFEAYSNALFQIISSSEYKAYHDYIQDKSAIDAAVAKYNRIANNSNSKEVWTAEDQELYDKYVDANAFKSWVDSQIQTVRTNARDNSRRGSTIHFDNAQSIINDLEKAYNKIKDALSTISSQVASLKAQLNDCNEDMAAKIREDIKELEQIADMERDFRETYELVRANIEKNSANKTELNTQLSNLDKVRDKIKAGTMEAATSDRTTAGSRASVEWLTGTMLDHRFQWNDFMDTKSDFYNQLKDLCDADGNGSGNKKKGDQEVKAANKAREDAEKELNADDTPDGLRSISAELAEKLKRNVDSGNVPGAADYFKNGLSLGAVSGALTGAVDRFLVAMYDFGMFSSRVTNIQPAADKEENGENSDYKDYSLTKYEMESGLNYLYGAELEYIYGGHTDSKSNLGDVRNIICGIRYAMNFTSSYTIQEVDAAIRAIADAAAAAVAASVVGAPAAPLVRAAVSAALRLAFATIETAADWHTLAYDRGVVTLLKREISELEAVDAIGSLLRVDLGKSTKDKVGLSYENYLFLMIFVFRDDNTILTRTGHLISLNVSQARNSGDTLTDLKFNINNTVTAVKATCTMKMDFAVLPESFAKMFLSGTSTEVTISGIEDTYLGYSIIRGY